MQHQRLETRLTDMDEPFDHDSTLHCVEWCRRYFHESMQSPLLRFNIGTYQLWQAYLAGDDEERLYTSWAAAMLHWLAAAEGLGCDTQLERAERWSALAPPDELDPDYLLKNITQATQQLCYITTTKPDTVRASRIDKDALGAAVGRLSCEVVRMIPVSRRAWAIQVEMERLTAFEWRSK